MINIAKTWIKILLKIQQKEKKFLNRIQSKIKILFLFK